MVYWNFKKNISDLFSLRGTPEFLKTYRGILEKTGLKKRIKDIRINNGIGSLEYGGNGYSCKIRDFLYKNSNIYLKRKYEIVKETKTVKRLSVTKKELNYLIKELGQQKKVAEKLGCSPATITILMKKFNS